MELAGHGARRLSAREEELLGLLAGFPDGDCGSNYRELSFSDLVEAGARPGADADAADDAPREEDRAAAAAALSSSPGRHETAALKQHQRRQQAARQRARRSGGGSRGSNFYVPPGLLTRSMTAPRPGRGGLPSPGAGQGQCGGPAKAAAAGGKPSRTQSPLGIGCWPALWGRGRERHRPAKACS